MLRLLLPTVTKTLEIPAGFNGLHSRILKLESKISELDCKSLSQALEVVEERLQLLERILVFVGVDKLNAQILKIDEVLHPKISTLDPFCRPPGLEPDREISPSKPQQIDVEPVQSSPVVDISTVNARVAVQGFHQTQHKVLGIPKDEEISPEKSLDFQTMLDDTIGNRNITTVAGFANSSCGVQTVPAYSMDQSDADEQYDGFYAFTGGGCDAHCRDSCHSCGFTGQVAEQLNKNFGVIKEFMEKCIALEAKLSTCEENIVEIAEFVGEIATDIGKDFHITYA